MDFKQMLNITLNLIHAHPSHHCWRLPLPMILYSVVPLIYKRSMKLTATYRKFTVAAVRFTQNVNCNFGSHPRYQQVTNVTRVINIQAIKAAEYVRYTP